MACFKLMPDYNMADLNRIIFSKYEVNLLSSRLGACY